MNAIRALIVDDEPIARRGIRQLLASHRDVEVVGEARNGWEAVRLLKALAPDLVFLDVQMPELDGFGVLLQLNQDKLPAVVFVTAHDAHAVRAFELHALDYLVKPVQEARFDDALSRARERLCSRQAVELSRQLSQMLADGLGGNAPSSRPPEPPRRLLIGTGGTQLIVDIAEIDWIEAEDYYAAVHVRGHRHLLRESITSLEERLDPSRFARVHRSAIVNLAQVREIRSAAVGDSVVLLRDGTELPLSRRRRKDVADAIRRFAG